MAINTDKAAKPVGAYVHAKEAGDLVFLSWDYLSLLVEVYNK